MKKNFDSLGQQMVYVNRFIHRNTDIKINCQYCGKPGRIRHYKNNPKQIHIVCVECSNKKNLNCKENWGKVLDDIPFINIEEHITNKFTLNKMIKLDKDTKKILRDMLKSDKPKIETFKNTGISSTYLNRLIDEYTKKVDKNYKKKLNKVFETNRCAKIKSIKLKYIVNTDSHPLAKLKLERNLSNRDIVKLSNNKLTTSCLCYIQEGKSNPTIITKIRIAEALKVSVKEIFPEETEFGEVYTWNDYWFNIRNEVINTINNYYNEEKQKGHKKILRTLSDITGIDLNRLYALKNKKALVNNEDYKKLKEHNILKEDI